MSRPGCSSGDRNTVPVVDERRQHLDQGVGLADPGGADHGEPPALAQVPGQSFAKLCVFIDRFQLTLKPRPRSG